MPLTNGCVVRRIEYRGEHGDIFDVHNLGRVVHVDPSADRFWVIPFPEKCVNRRRSSSDGERQRYYIKRPWIGSISKFEAEEKNTYDFVSVDPPQIHLYDDTALQANSTAGVFYRTRRQLSKSLEVRDARYALIEPIVTDATILQLLDQDWVKEKCTKRAAELGLKSTSELVRCIRLWTLWGLHKNALLPRFDRINIRGSEKLPRGRDGKPPEKAGAKRRTTKRLMPGEGGSPMTAEYRKRLRAGWKRFKVREGFSIKDAYSLTLRHNFAEKVSEDGPTDLWTPEQKQALPTLAQFTWHGPGKDPAQKAARANLAPGVYEKTMRPRVGTSSDELLAVGFAAQDSTSCDQNLVSLTDPLQLLMSPYDTKVVDRYCGYVTGWHCGFQPRSRLTTLMAIANAASDKVEFCARYGVEIEPDDWLSVPISGVKLDNGEGKSAEAIDVMTGTGISLEFISPYRSDRNGEIETVHRALARAGAHKVLGSTQGKRRNRSERNPMDDAAVNFGELMPILIKAILKYNNEDPVPPEKLTIEMRQDKVKPTRQGIMKWMLEKGRVTSAPLGMSMIRVRCLPRLRGTIVRGILHLVDPRCNRKNQPTRVKGLRYRIQPQSGQCMPDLSKATSCDVHIDPDYLGKGWLLYEGLVPIELITNDEQMRRCSLSEWLAITDDEAVAAQLAAREHTLNDSARLEEIRVICAQAKTRRKEAEAAEEAEKGRALSKARLRANRRDNTAKERERLANEELGLGNVPSQPPSTPSPAPQQAAPASNANAHPSHAASAGIQALNNYRAQRAAQR